MGSMNDKNENQALAHVRPNGAGGTGGGTDAELWCKHLLDDHLRDVPGSPPISQLLDRGESLEASDSWAGKRQQSVGQG